MCIRDRHGGTLMQWVDIIGAVAATRHAHSTVTTAALDSMDFKHPVPLGAIVTLQAAVTWTGRTSLEVRVDVYSEKSNCVVKKRTNTAYLVFVALGYDGKPHEVPPFTPRTDSEKDVYKRQQRAFDRGRKNGDRTAVPRPLPSPPYPQRRGDTAGICAHGQDERGQNTQLRRLRIQMCIRDSPHAAS